MFNSIGRFSVADVTAHPQVTGRRRRGASLVRCLEARRYGWRKATYLSLGLGPLTCKRRGWVQLRREAGIRELLPKYLQPNPRFSKHPVQLSYVSSFVCWEYSVANSAAYLSRYRSPFVVTGAASHDHFGG
jgi:hypothetical protein